VSTPNSKRASKIGGKILEVTISFTKLGYNIDRVKIPVEIKIRSLW